MKNTQYSTVRTVLKYNLKHIKCYCVFQKNMASISEQSK